MKLAHPNFHFTDKEMGLQRVVCVSQDLTVGSPLFVHRRIEEACLFFRECIPTFRIGGGGSALYQFCTHGRLHTLHTPSIRLAACSVGTGSSFTRPWQEVQPEAYAVDRFRRNSVCQWWRTGCLSFEKLVVSLVRRPGFRSQLSYLWTLCP